MSLRYLLDGYNITCQMPQWNHKDVDAQRAALVTFLEHHRPQGSLKNGVTVIFDGTAGRCSPERSSIVDVIFSCHESADDRIKKVVEQSSQKKSLVVVTDDRDIQYAVRALGATVVGVQAFMSKGRNAREKKQRTRSPGVPLGDKTEKTKPISYQDAFDITAEMKDVWIDKKKKRP